jgi:hypothetical protein
MVMPFNELNNPVLKDIEDVYRSNDPNTIPSLSNVKDGLLDATHSYNDPNMSTHKIEDNESMYAIANKLGKHPDEIKEVNNLANAWDAPAYGYNSNDSFLPGDYINLPIDIMGRPGAYTPPQKNWEEVGDNPWDTDWNEAFRSLENIADINERVRLGNLYRERREYFQNNITNKNFWTDLAERTPKTFLTHNLQLSDLGQDIRLRDLPAYRTQDIQRALYNDGKGLTITKDAWDEARNRQIEIYQNLSPEDRILVDHWTGSPLNQNYWEGKVHIAFTPRQEFQAQLAPGPITMDSRIEIIPQHWDEYINAYGFVPQDEPRSYPESYHPGVPSQRNPLAVIMNELLVKKFKGLPHAPLAFDEYPDVEIPQVMMLNFSPWANDMQAATGYSAGAAPFHEILHLRDKQHTGGQYQINLNEPDARGQNLFLEGIRTHEGVDRKIDTREIGQYLGMAIFDERLKLDDRTSSLTFDNVIRHAATKVRNMMGRQDLTDLYSKLPEALTKEDENQVSWETMQADIPYTPGRDPKTGKRIWIRKPVHFWQDLLLMIQNIKDRPGVINYYENFIGMSNKETAHA